MAFASGRWHKSLIERTAFEMLEEQDLSQEERTEITDDLSMFQSAMDAIIKSEKCDKISVIIAISKAFIIGLRAPQSEEKIAAIRAAAETALRKNNGTLGGLRLAEIAQTTWLTS